jgi:aryl-alcohol dehydrogenase-like predicted oxidoreductase
MPPVLTTTKALPGTTLAPSRIAFGTANLGVRQTTAEAERLLDVYVERGGNFLDTARVYSDWVPGEQGRSERIIGDWLRRRPGVREHLVLGTKGLHYEWHAGRVPRVTARDARKDVEASLRVLGVDRIDLYWLHRDDPALSAESILEFMQEFVAEGKVRYLGAANWPIDRIDAANIHATRHGLAPFVASQPMFNIGCWHSGPASDPTLVTLDREAFAYHCASKLPVVAYSSQAQGFFSRAAAGADLASLAPSVRRRYETPANMALAEVIRDIAAAKGCNANAVVLAYLLHQPFRVVPIVGSNTVAQLDDSIAAAGLELHAREIRALAEANGSNQTAGSSDGHIASRLPTTPRSGS